MLTIFSQHRYIMCKLSNGMDTAAIRHLVQKSDQASLLVFHKPYLNREEYPSLNSRALFTSSSCKIDRLKKLDIFQSDLAKLPF